MKLFFTFIGNNIKGNAILPIISRPGDFTFLLYFASVNFGLGRLRFDDRFFTLLGGDAFGRFLGLFGDSYGLLSLGFSDLRFGFPYR